MTTRAVIWTLMALALLTAVLLAWSWLAGYAYFALNKAWPRHIELQTWWLYWQAYGQDPAQRRRLLLAAILPAVLLLGAVAAALAPLLQPRPRPLHGDARWATEREIRDEGLL